MPVERTAVAARVCVCVWGGGGAWVVPPPPHIFAKNLLLKRPLISATAFPRIDDVAPRFPLVKCHILLVLHVVQFQLHTYEARHF